MPAQALLGLPTGSWGHPWGPQGLQTVWATPPIPSLRGDHTLGILFGPYEPSRSLQPIRKDLVIRFRQQTSDGGDHGCEGDFGKEICCTADRRRQLERRNR